MIFGQLEQPGCCVKVDKMGNEKRIHAVLWIKILIKYVLQVYFQEFAKNITKYQLYWSVWSKNISEYENRVYSMSQ